SEVTGTRFRRRLEVMIGVRGWEYEVSRRLRGMLSLVDPAVKSWRTSIGPGSLLPLVLLLVIVVVSVAVVVVVIVVVMVIVVGVYLGPGCLPLFLLLSPHSVGTNSGHIRPALETIVVMPRVISFRVRVKSSGSHLLEFSFWAYSVVHHRLELQSWNMLALTRP
ncbi:hypothetical protein Tco_1277087, partial [Tanacetum coccineum]